GAYAAAAAMCVGTAFGLHLARTAEALRYLEMPKNRMGVSIGKKGTYILNDSAASTEEAMQDALEAALGMPAKRVIGVFGEVGKQASEWRMQDTLNRLAVKVCDAMITVGDSPINVDSKKKIRFDNGEAAAAELQAITERGDLVLVTGLGLEAVVDLLSSYRLVVRT
ncbi:MAG: cyanophycin synthetase, partial [bacterium]|nr:cyanophycin synthetase [bacterium]